MPDDKVQLHQSMIGMLYSCGEQFRRRYGARFGWNDREEIIAPGVALLIGRATHQSIEQNIGHKIEHDELLPIEAVADAARDAVEGEWSKEVHLTDEEAGNKDKTKGALIDTAVNLSVLHGEKVAPMLRPVSVERKWVVELEGFPYDLAGTFDIEEEGHVIRDTKTAAKAKSQKDADSAEQLTMYSMAKTVCDGVTPDALYIDCLVKTKVPKVVTLMTTRVKHQHVTLLRRIERAVEIIDKGAFTPADPNDWRCSKKFCGFALTCPYWGGK